MLVVNGRVDVSLGAEEVQYLPIRFERTKKHINDYLTNKVSIHLVAMNVPELVFGQLGKGGAHLTHVHALARSALAHKCGDLYSAKNVRFII